ncbi:hypothetical protein [Rhodophyticola porphyridii]|uniref:hypothetical protein n=1 Tax=Rhodophyticola porphyridii TaxID=1852017 RepID=UPI0035CEE702
MTACRRPLTAWPTYSANRLGVDLPDVLTVALSSLAQSVMDVLTGEGLGDLDLDAEAVLAVPL